MLLTTCRAEFLKSTASTADVSIHVSGFMLLCLYVVLGQLLMVNIVVMLF